jgi:bacillithiol biosynthesis cysteine-adding enzyme BshC
MQAERIAYADTGRFAAPVIDHLNGDPFIREFLQLPPDLEGLKHAAAERRFSEAYREVLCAALDRQHARLDLHQAVRANLERLKRPDALTVTTGHQLCLFTGPLYVPYKILNAIRLAREAEQALGRPVVPVFWMATEDHDAAEIDHATINGRTVRWNGASGGAVGRMPLTGIQSTVEEAIAALGPGEHAGWVADRLRAAYADGRTLAEATRQFVHDLFGHTGLVIVDGDDHSLKQLLAPIVEEEVLNNIAQRTVAYADERIKERYSVQAHARAINVFHLRPGHRSRIVPDGEHFQVLDGGPRWTVEELLNEIRRHPQAFSPNVLLRPVYQEVVLPNIAYVGGGGELAYWIQLRWLFQALQVPMPVVFLRTSAATLSAKHLRQWQEMGLSTVDLFAPLDPLKAAVAKRNASFRTELTAERAELERAYSSMLAAATKGDASLRGAVEARRTQALRGVERLEKAMVRAAKRDQEVVVQRVDIIHEALFPGGGLQERRDNILPLIAAQGIGALGRWSQLLDPLGKRFVLAVED